MDDGRVQIEVTGDTRQAQSAIDAVKRDVQSLSTTANSVKPLSNELRGLTASFQAGETDRARFVRDLGHIRREALEAAQGLSKTGDEYVQLQQVAARATRELRNANDEAARAGQQRSGGGLEGTISNLIAGYGAMEIAQQGLRLTELGVDSKKAEQGFVAMSGGAEAATQNLLAMKEASNGSLSQMQAQQNAAMMLSTGLADNSQELGQLTHNAIVLGEAFRNLKPPEAVEQFTALLANQSPDRLNEFGLSVGQVRDRIKELQEANGNMTREQAFTQAVIEASTQRVQALEAAGYAAGSGLSQAAAAGADFRAGVGEGLAGTLEQLTTGLGAAGQMAGVASINFNELGTQTVNTMLNMSGLKASIDSLQVLGPASQALQNHASATQFAAESAALLATAEAQAADAMARLPLDDTAGQTQLVAQAFMDAGYAAGYTNGELIAMWEAAGGTRDELGLLGDKTIALVDRLYKVSDAARQATADILRFKEAAYDRQLSGINTAVPLDTRFGMQEATAYNNQVLRTGADEFFEETPQSKIDNANWWLTHYQERLPAAVATGGRRAASQAEKDAQAIQKAYESAYQEIQSTVRGEMDMGIGVSRNDQLMTNAGQYEDKFNEAGRRLEDVVNRGKDSEWADDFFGNLTGLTDDQLKASAARLQDRISRYLEPQYLNTDALYERAKERIIGNRNQKAIIDEVSQRLQNEGYMEVEIGGAMQGVATPAAVTTGQTAAAEMMSAMGGAVRAQAEAQKDQFRELGRYVGGEMSAGLIEAITGENYVRPLAQAIIAQINTEARA